MLKDFKCTQSDALLLAISANYPSLVWGGCTLLKAPLLLAEAVFLEQVRTPC